MPYAHADLDWYLNEIHREPLLNSEEILMLARAVRQGDLVARQRLISGNLRLVIKVARRYRDLGLSFADLIAEGNLGLIHAADKYDPDRGFRFSTYAVCWIKHAICRALTDTRQMIRIPSYLRKRLLRCRRMAEQLAIELGRSPKPSEVAAHFPKLTQTQRKMLEAALITDVRNERIGSLNQDAAQDPTLIDPRAEGELDRVANAGEEERLFAALAHCCQRKARVLRLRFGLDDGQPLTLQEVGDRVGLTKERVRQIEKEMLDTLRSRLATGPVSETILETRSKKAG